MSCREIEQDLNFKIYEVGPKAKRPKNKKTPTHPMTMPQVAGKNLLWLLDNNTFTRNCNLLPSFHLTGSKNTSSWPIYSGVPNAGVAKKVELTAGSTETEEELARNRYECFFLLELAIRVWLNYIRHKPICLLELRLPRTPV